MAPNHTPSVEEGGFSPATNLRAQSWETTPRDKKNNAFFYLVVLRTAPSTSYHTILRNPTCSKEGWANHYSYKATAAVTSSTKPLKLQLCISEQLGFQ